MQHARRPWSESRVGRIVSFVAITWAVAGGFLLLQQGLPTLVDTAVRRGWIPDSLVLPASRSSSSDCGAAIQRAHSLPTDARVAGQSRLLVWRMGFQTGFAAGIASATAGSRTPPDTASLLDQPRQIAQMLGVEPPVLQTIRHAATSLSEFQAFVAQDSGCVAAEIGEKYSARQAALYKFGLVVGHSAVYRINVPQVGPLFVSELRVYGSQADLPSELWRPFVDDSLDALPGDGVQQKVQFALSRVDEHLNAHP